MMTRSLIPQQAHARAIGQHQARREKEKSPGAQARREARHAPFFSPSTTGPTPSSQGSKKKRHTETTSLFAYAAKHPGLSLCFVFCTLAALRASVAEAASKKPKPPEHLGFYPEKGKNRTLFCVSGEDVPGDAVAYRVHHWDNLDGVQSFAEYANSLAGSDTRQYGPFMPLCGTKPPGTKAEHADCLRKIANLALVNPDGSTQRFAEKASAQECEQQYQRMTRRP